MSLAKIAAQLVCGASIVFSSFASFGQSAVGVYRWDAPTGPANVDAFSTWLGRPVDIAAAFEANDSWANVDGAEWQLGPWSQWVAAKSGRNISLAVPLLPASGATLAACAAGQYDTYWANLANTLATYRLHWAYLRLGWEPDGGWYAWGAPQGSGKEASYAGCFRKVVQVMRQTQPANQWKFVWNPTTAWWGPEYLPTIWPGDAYVDVVGLDIYDQSWSTGTYPYAANCDAACRLAAQKTAWEGHLWRLTTMRDFAFAHGKPMAIPEWGVATRPDGHGGGDDPFFVEQMAAFINDPANKVLYHVWFNVSAGDIDARLTDSVQGDNPTGPTRYPNSAAAYRKAFGPTSSTPPAANTAPTVTLTAPASGQTVSGAVAYSANATDNAGVSRVDFSLDGAALFSDSAAPYGGSLNTAGLTNGTHVLKATAYDAQGLSATTQVSINVQNAVTPPPTTTPPPTGGTPAPTAGALSVWFKAPLAGTTLSGTRSGVNCYVKATGSVQRVVFTIDGAAINTDSAPADGMNCALDTTKFANGSHRLRAVAFDASGASKIDEIAVNIQNTVVTPTPTPTPTPSTPGATPAPGTGALSVWFKAPLNGSTVSGVLSAGTGCYAMGTGVVGVWFYLDATALHDDHTMADGMQCSFDTRRFANGLHTLKVTAWDAAGQSKSDVITVRIAN